MKKILSALLAALMLLSATACAAHEPAQAVADSLSLIHI